MKRMRIAVAIRDACLALVLVLAGTATARSATVTLTLPKLEAAAGKEVEVPVNVKGAEGLSALYVRLTYDPSVLEVVKDESDPNKGITKGKIIPKNAFFRVYTTTIQGYRPEGDKLVPGEMIPVKPGGLPITFAGGVQEGKMEYHAIQEDGTLVTIRFRVIGDPGKKTSLGFELAEAFESNDMAMIVKTEPGEITIVRAIPWLWIAIAAGVVVLLLLVILVSRRCEAPQATQAGAGAASGQVPVFHPEVATFQYQCSKCGGTLTLPVLMAGKQIKCSACGTTQVAMP